MTSLAKIGPVVMENKSKNIKSLQIDPRQRVIRKAQLNFQLRWAKNFIFLCKHEREYSTKNNVKEKLFLYDKFFHLTSYHIQCYRNTSTIIYIYLTLLLQFNKIFLMFLTYSMYNFWNIYTLAFLSSNNCSAYYTRLWNY